MSSKIAIIGAGPSGLCLANILQRHNVPFTLFEGDKSIHERNQGGTLDLHPQHGQLALKEAGLWDDFIKYARPESDVMKVTTADGKVLWDGNGADKQEIAEEQKYDHRPEIDREKLQHILFERVNTENVKFGMHLVEVQPTSTGKYNLLFKDGTVESEFDIVVGAEGAWSKVRKLLTDELPHYAGVTAVEFWAENVDEDKPWLSNYVGMGSCFCFDEGRAVMMQRLGDGTIRSYACLRKPETFLQGCGIDWTKPGAGNEYVDTYFGDCGEDIQRALKAGDSKHVPRALYMLPVGFSWQPRRGVTLLGDAAHLMTPFAGVGVNAALADALDLAKCIVKAREASAPIQDAVVKYESRLFSRGEKFAQKTYKNLQGHFAAGGSEKFAQRFRDHYYGPGK